MSSNFCVQKLLTAGLNTGKHLYMYSSMNKDWNERKIENFN